MASRTCQPASQPRYGQTWGTRGCCYQRESSCRAPQLISSPRSTTKNITYRSSSSLNTHLHLQLMFHNLMKLPEKRPRPANDLSRLPSRDDPPFKRCLLEFYLSATYFVRACSCYAFHPLPKYPSSPFFSFFFCKHTKRRLFLVRSQSSYYFDTLIPHWFFWYFFCFYSRITYLSTIYELF